MTFSFLLRVGQAERRALDAKQEFDHCSKLIKTEVARFERERIEDFKDSLQAFLDGMISRQKEVSAVNTYYLLFSVTVRKELILFFQLISVWENYQQLLLKRLGAQPRQNVNTQTAGI